MINPSPAFGAERITAVRRCVRERTDIYIYIYICVRESFVRTILWKSPVVRFGLPYVHVLHTHPITLFLYVGLELRTKGGEGGTKKRIRSLSKRLSNENRVLNVSSRRGRRFVRLIDGRQMFRSLSHPRTPLTVVVITTESNAIWYCERIFPSFSDVIRPCHTSRSSYVGSFVRFFPSVLRPSNPPPVAFNGRRCAFRRRRERRAEQRNGRYRFYA